MAKITLQGYKCERCGHEWLPTSDVEPKVCPKCKSPYWNRPRINKSRTAEEQPRQPEKS